jgi:hypothetical protein
MLLTRQGISL